MQEVESICDRIIIINNGQMVVDKDLGGKPSKNLKEQLVIVEFSEKVSKDKLQKAFPKSKIKKAEAQWIIAYNGDEDLRLMISNFAQNNKLHILEIKKHMDNLDDLFKKSNQISFSICCFFYICGRIGGVI